LGFFLESFLAESLKIYLGQEEVVKSKIRLFVNLKYRTLAAEVLLCLAMG